MQTITLSEAFERHYPKDELAKSTVAKYRLALKRWATHTGDPPLSAVTDRTAADYRAAMLNTYSPATARSDWLALRCVLRLCAPADSGNPLGLGMLDKMVYFKPIKVISKRPYRIPLDDLSRLHQAARFAQYPKNVGFSPEYWWTALIVLAYFTGLRKGDLMALRWDQIDFRRQTIDIVARKTDKDDQFPLHDLAAAHLHRLRRPAREQVFSGFHWEGGFYSKEWKFLTKTAGVRHFVLHDVRRVGAAELDRVDRGIGRVFLQHSPRNITEAHYVWPLEDVTEAFASPRFRIPEAFRSVDALPCDNHRRAAWEFTPAGARYRGRPLRLGPRPLAVLRALVAAGPERPLDFADLRPVVWWDRPDDVNRTTIKTTILQLREALARQLELPPVWNAVPMVRGRGWSLCLP